MVNIIINEKQLSEELEHQSLPHSPSSRLTSFHQLTASGISPKENSQSIQRIKIRQSLNSKKQETQTSRGKKLLNIKNQPNAIWKNQEN